jgi:hypothetical protein
VKETRRSYSFKRGRGIVLVRKAGGDDFDGRSNAQRKRVAVGQSQSKVLSLSNIRLPFLQ